jgi:hypothetical protein
MFQPEHFGCAKIEDGKQLILRVAAQAWMQLGLAGRENVYFRG